VADQTLRGTDQRRVATFFRDPDKAQDVRMPSGNAMCASVSKPRLSVRADRPRLPSPAEGTRDAPSASR
jgi:hypothetical protein